MRTLCAYNKAGYWLLFKNSSKNYKVRECYLDPFNNNSAINTFYSISGADFLY